MRLAMAGLLLSCALICNVPAQAQAPSGAPPVPPRHDQRPGPPAAAMEMPATAAGVGMNEPVITIKGACQGADAAKSGCTSAVTREQFEKLTGALKADMSLDQKRTFAMNYGKLMVFYDAARSLGLENDPKVQQVFSFAQKQILLQALNEHYSDEYAHPSDQQIQAYYDQNSKKYRESNLERVIVPRSPGTPDMKPPSEADMKAYADQIRKKWADGGDPVALQKEALTKMGLTSASPDPNIGPKQPGSLPAGQEEVFDLKAGEVSQPFPDSAAFYIYKVVSVRQLPLAEVKDSISKAIHDQELKDKIQQISQQGDPVLNAAYFGEEKPAGATGAPGPPMAPPSSASTPPQPH